MVDSLHNGSMHPSDYRRAGSQPIIVRLPNWVGDVVMALPALERLDSAGLAPWLVGRRWAGSLLAGQSWTVLALAPQSGSRIEQLRQWRDAARAIDVRFDRRLNALLLPNSLSSGWEAWRAGLKALGYRNDGRGWLLAAAIPRPRTPLHESERFSALATALVDRIEAQMRDREAASGSHDRPVSDRPAAAPRPWPMLAIAAADAARADALLRERLSVRRFACIVPFAAGTLAGRRKDWPQFPAFARRLAEQLPVVVVPGPGETEAADSSYPDAVRLDGIALGTYAAILARAAVVIANDTGPAHVAAAVGAPVVSVLGPTDATRHRPLGPRVSVVQADPWPTIAAVEAAVEAQLTASAVDVRVAAPPTGIDAGPVPQVGRAGESRHH
jgi:heptosyltransferase-2